MNYYRLVGKINNKKIFKRGILFDRIFCKGMMGGAKQRQLKLMEEENDGCARV